MTERIHYVKRAIIMAAGKGERMHPITFTTPKPLVRVNGTRMISSAIDALYLNGINEIYIVVGYLKNCFQELKKEYPSIELIDNPYYNDCNNISSLYVARKYIGECNCMILDGDQIINNYKVLSPEFTRSGYNAVWRNTVSSEWMLDVKDGIIKHCSRNGGAHAWQLYSVSRWTAEDGEKLRHHVETEFENGHRDIYWDDVAMFRYFDQYCMGIREMNENDIIEIDGIDELAAVDNHYSKS